MSKPPLSSNELEAVIAAALADTSAGQISYAPVSGANQQQARLIMEWLVKTGWNLSLEPVAKAQEPKP